MSSARIGPNASSTPAFSSDEAVWLELAAVSPTLLARLGAVPMQLVALHSAAGPENRPGGDPCCTTGGRKNLPCLLQLVPVLPPDGGDDAIVRVHPLVAECCRAAADDDDGAGRAPTRSPARTAAPGQRDEEGEESALVRVRLRPMSLPYSSVTPYEEVTAGLSKVSKHELDFEGFLEVEIVYLDPELEQSNGDQGGDLSSSADCSRFEDAIGEALQGRWIMKDTSHVLSIRGACAVVLVHNVRSAADPDSPLEEVGYRLGRLGTFRVQVLPDSDDEGDCGAMVVSEPNHFSPSQHGNPALVCPGYEHVVNRIKGLLTLQGPAAPAGVLLSGCRGVGKSSVASCVAQHISDASSAPAGSRWIVHSLSLNDLLRRASWETEDDLMMALLPTHANPVHFHKRLLLVVDDLDVLSVPDVDSVSDLDPERRLVRNSLVQAVDHWVGSGHKVLCVSQDGVAGSRLPPELLKPSRLEVVVTMEPPTQTQREKMLSCLLRRMDIEDEGRCQSWSELIASRTQGCVASDLNRLCVDAVTLSLSRSDNGSDPDATDLQFEDIVEAARSCIPSQLAELDVTKPLLLLPDESAASPEGWRRIHEASWSSFAGFSSTILRIYRTVVVPWRIYIRDRDSAEANVDPVQIPPPSGVLFHGAPGNGKSVACGCLGSSLGFPMIRVRAADVLDKYLGGSEAVVRSLFARARSASPVILLFDEIDSIASNRASDGDGTGVMSRILSTLLNEMDGVASGLREPVLVLACTNRLDSLDAALLRPGRLEEHIEFSSPTVEDAEAILKLYLRQVTLDETVSLNKIATELVLKGSSSAAIEGYARETVLTALRRLEQLSTTERVSVRQKDFDEALKLWE